MYYFKKFFSLISLFISDATSFFSAFMLSFFIRSKILPQVFHSFQKELLPLNVQMKFGILYGTIIIIVLTFEKLYIKRFDFWEETRHLLKGITLSFFVVIMIAFITGGYLNYSRVILVITWIISLIIFPISRLGVKKILVRLNLWRKRILILGTDKLAQLAAQEIEKNEILGYEIAGFLTSDNNMIGKELGEYRVLGGVFDYRTLSKKLEVKDVIIAHSKISQDKLIKILAHCEGNAETIRIIPRLGNIFTLGVEIDNIGDILSLSIAQNLIKPWNTFIKGTFELLLSLISILLCLPVFIITGIAIKLDSPGPVLFVQDRLGKKNKIFKCYKFRSMYIDSDRRLKEYLKKNPSLIKEWEKYQKLKGHDPRVTRVGSIIRKYSLDEIPQLINFFKREINLVGPRPYLPREKNTIGKSYQIISRIKPGITGLWQVRGRQILPFKERLILDEYYVRNWSLWLDIVIILKTIKALTTREGAF